MLTAGVSQLSCSASAGLLKEFALPLSIFASKDVRPFTYTEFMNKRLLALPDKICTELWNRV